MINDESEKAKTQSTPPPTKKMLKDKKFSGLNFKCNQDLLPMTNLSIHFVPLLFATAAY